METMAGTIRSMIDTATPFEESPKLTQFAHGGGCGCKIAPGLLREILARAPQGLVPPELMVGTETADDAAVYRLNATQALVATTDFFTPIVDDPYDFGRIAATNALSDIYAMGGTPILALALVGMPIAKLAPEVIQRANAKKDWEEFTRMKLREGEHLKKYYPLSAEAKVEYEAWRKR